MMCNKYIWLLLFSSFIHSSQKPKELFVKLDSQKVNPDKQRSKRDKSDSLRLLPRDQSKKINFLVDY